MSRNCSAEGLGLRRARRVVGYSLPGGDRSTFQGRAWAGLRASPERVLASVRLDRRAGDRSWSGFVRPAKELGLCPNATGNLAAGDRAGAGERDDQICILKTSFWLQRGGRPPQTRSKTRARDSWQQFPRTSVACVLMAFI